MCKVCLSASPRPPHLAEFKYHVPPDAMSDPALVVHVRSSHCLDYLLNDAMTIILVNINVIIV